MRISLITGPMVSLYYYARKRATQLICLAIFSSFFLIHVTSAQELQSNVVPKWAEMMYGDNPAVELVSKAYDHYYESRDFVKNRFTQDYKRFIRQNTRNAFDQSDFTALRSSQKAYESKLLESKMRNSEANWAALGPFDVDLNSSAVGSTPGLAHIYTVEKSLTNSNLLIAGAATAGVWKSTDNGSTWRTLTKDLMVTEVKAVEISSTNSSMMFFGGGGNIYKSSNGGSSWKTTGSSSFKSQYHHVLDIISVPNNGSVVYAATNKGLYQSKDAGENWNLKVSGAFQEIEIHPTNSEIVYAIKQNGNGTQFFRSIDGGDNFAISGTGYPSVSGSQEQKRTEISVTPADPDKIVALATGVANGGSGLFGIYVSEDQGSTWTFKCCGTGPGGAPSSTNVNIMAWQTNGLASGGQYYYDLALGVSATNAEVIYSGGINIWKSVDGGSSFVNNADYIFKSAGQKYVHADIQDIKIYGDEIWVATDGGIFMSDDNAKTFSKRMYGIVGTDFRGFGAGANDGEVLIGGTYHNGTLVKENNTYQGGWLSTHSGDNTQGNVNPSNNMITYSDIGIMVLPGNRLSVPSVKSPSVKPNSSYSTGESSEYVFSPNSADEYYIGSGGGLYKTVDNGSNFSLLKNFGSGKVTKIEIAPSNTDVIYVVYYPNFDSHKQLFKTNDGGNSWLNITPPTSIFGNTKLWIAWDISVSGTDENVLWLARTPQKSANALVNGYHIFKTSDGGNSWDNISSSSLNGELITNIVHQKGTAGGVYAGTRRAVYYKNDNMSEWKLFQNGLPALTYSTNLVILYEQNKIINATHRGVYASEVYETVDYSLAYQVDKTEGLCENDLFSFTSQLTGFTSKAYFSWTFENGVPSSSSEANPTVRFQGVGDHDVSLTVSENGNSKTITNADFISILDLCETDTYAGNAFSSYVNNYLVIPAMNKETNEITFSTWIKRVGSTKDNAGIIMMQRFSQSTGLSFTSAGEVKYQWDEAGTGNPTGLFVEREEWTHIAFSVSPTNLKVYVNGIERSFPGIYDSVNFDKNILLGKDANAFPYYFNGYFDEFAIYDATLSIDEIRSKMNLVKFDDENSNLIHYYQFNDEEEIVKDIQGSNHASFSKFPDYANSMAPIGKGVSQVQLIEELGFHHFEEIGVELDITAGVSCESELGIYKIERNEEGSNDSHSDDHIYLINHFAEDEFLISGELAIAGALPDVEEGVVSNDSFKLYQLGFDDLPEWSSSEVEYAKDFAEDKIIFDISEESDMQGKFLVAYNAALNVLPVSDIYFDLHESRPGVVDVNWFLNPEDHFTRTELQRSGNGDRFETIAAIENEVGKIHFNYLDESPNQGKNYYRVKMYNPDKSFDYSKIDFINIDSAPANFVFPNPVSEKDYVSLQDVDINSASVNIFDMRGQKVISYGKLSSSRIDISSLSPGSYLIQVDEKTNSKQQLVIIY